MKLMVWPRNSCWILINGKNMWFASYGGGISKFDGKKIHCFHYKKTVY
jgi:hypothetical protein